MPSIASRSRKQHTAFCVALASVAVVAALGAGSSRAEGPAGASGAAPAAPSASFGRGNNPYADRFPNLVLKTHQGEVVRFYDDLLKGKIVLINFMYASCEER